MSEMTRQHARFLTMPNQQMRLKKMENFQTIKNCFLFRFWDIFYFELNSNDLPTIQKFRIMGVTSFLVLRTNFINFSLIVQKSKILRTNKD